MRIEIEDTEFREEKIIQGAHFYDQRGFFTKNYKKLDYLSFGTPKFVQDDLSKSSKGVIRGFQALEEGTRVHYKVTNYWNKESEKSLNLSAKKVDMQWHKIAFEASSKDLSAPSLEQIYDGT
jgi:dTDP-4-dehydrorhamnose 3,5-epimerase-like enzyme